MPIRYKQQELITPAKARKLIDANAENNRNVMPSAVSRYAADMKAGLWEEETGETIKITPDGVLIDGAQRMHAVNESGCSIRFDMAYGVPARAMTVLDTGRSRSFKDTLKVAGLTHYHLEVASVVRRVTDWERGNFVLSGFNYVPLSVSTLRQRYEEDVAGFLAAVGHGKDLGAQKIGMKSVSGAFFYIANQISEKDTYTFFESLLNPLGAGLPENHPAWTLRERLRKRGSKGKERLRPYEQLALFVRAWNAFRGDRLLLPSNLYTVSGGQPLTNKNFPKPV